MDDRILQELIQEVHSNLQIEKYNETNVRENTNCYSHALGATYPELMLYRIGEISGKKSIGKKYSSIQEIKDLLFYDLEKLKLEIEESSIEEQLTNNQHKIALFIKTWQNGQIADYHFWRFENGIWTEKWKGRRMNIIEDFERDKLVYFPWSLEGIYKIQR